MQQRLLGIAFDSVEKLSKEVMSNKAVVSKCFSQVYFMK